MFVVAIYAKVSPGKREEFLQTVRSLQNEDGARNFRAYQDVEDRHGFNLVHEWETEEDLGNYLDGENFKVLRGALKVLCTGVEVKYGVAHEDGGRIAEAFEGSFIETLEGGDLLL